MNDYLTNLAARALAPSPAIVPRQGSLFEPAAARIGPLPLRPSAGDLASTDETIEIEPVPAAVRPRHAPAMPRPASERPAEPTAPLRAVINPQPPASLPLHPRDVQTAVEAAKRPPGTESLVAQPAAELPQKAAQIAAPRLSPVAPDRTRPARDAAEDSRQETHSREPRRLRERKLDTSDAAGEHRDSERQSMRSAAPAREPFAPKVVVAPPSRFEPVSAAPSQQPAAPPTIRITIGRVEVRAVAAPAAATGTSRSAKTPRLSLEDYLKDRSGDRR